MSLRDRLKKREERREKAANGGINAGLPEGVTRYVRLGQELKDGKDFVILRDPNLWFFYYVHEDGDYATRATYVKKHTCLWSPRKAPDTEDEAEALFDKYARPNPDECISDKAGAKRVLYFMVPVYDVDLGVWRVLDLKEFHVNNLLSDMDKVERAARKFSPGYTMIGDVVTIKKADKSYTVSSSDREDTEGIEAAVAKLNLAEIDYEELANFRETADIVKLLQEADGSRVDKSVLPAAADASAEPGADDYEPISEDGPGEEVRF